MDYVLKTNALCKQYKDFKALSGVTMSVPKGSVYGFVGRNGAGKTTLIRLICGMQFPTDGEFEIYGVKNTDSAISDSRKRIGAVVETPSLFPEMSAQDNLKYQYRLLGLPSFEGITELLKLVGLENTGKKKAKDFSLGMRQRLGIAVALCGNPDFLILDEPINGLDPQGIIEIRELILKLNRERNITVLISSHILDELARLATHYGFIDKGSIVREMSAEELEAACRKRTRINVSDTFAAVKALDDMKLEYRDIGDNYIDIYAKPNISKLSAALEKENCEILSCTEHDETLEGFFISLVGGGSDE